MLVRMLERPHRSAQPVLLANMMGTPTLPRHAAAVRQGSLQLQAPLPAQTVLPALWTPTATLVLPAQIVVQARTPQLWQRPVFPVELDSMQLLAPPAAQIVQLGLLTWTQMPLQSALRAALAHLLLPHQRLALRVQLDDTLGLELGRVLNAQLASTMMTLIRALCVLTVRLGKRLQLNKHLHALLAPLVHTPATPAKTL